MTLRRVLFGCTYLLAGAGLVIVLVRLPYRFVDSDADFRKRIALQQARVAELDQIARELAELQVEYSKADKTCRMTEDSIIGEVPKVIAELVEELYWTEQSIQACPPNASTPDQDCMALVAHRDDVNRELEQRWCTRRAVLELEKQHLIKLSYVDTCKSLNIEQAKLKALQANGIDAHENAKRSQ